MAKKQEYFGTSPKWNPAKVKANFAKYAPSMARLQWAMKAGYEEWLDAIRESPDEFAWLGYH
jgi:hypothetical protein